MKKNALLVGILAMAVVATVGAGWLSAQSATLVGEGKTVHVMRTPT